MTRTNHRSSPCSLFVAAAPHSRRSLQMRAGPVATATAPTPATACASRRATGSLVETVQCWTRAQWVEQGVDVDKAWAKEGVAIKQ